MKQIKIFDTTLRDGEQAPGCSMNPAEKTEVARALERLKVDVIEAGFAISSKGDFESVKSIAELIKDSSVASLARAVQKKISTLPTRRSGAGRRLGFIFFSRPRPSIWNISSKCPPRRS